MNNLTKGNEKFMTVKEVAEIFECSKETVRASIRKFFPEILKHGVKTYLNEKQITEIRNDINLHHNRQSSLPLPKTDTEIQDNDLKIMFKAFMIQQQENNKKQDQFNKVILELINNNKTQQIEFQQDYYSIIGYANNKEIQIAFSEAVRFGREAAKLSKIEGKEIRKIADERFGFVGSYHISILNEIFKI